MHRYIHNLNSNLYYINFNMKIYIEQLLIGNLYLNLVCYMFCHCTYNSKRNAEPMNNNLIFKRKLK